ncbi:MAG TPA: VOC family protein [Methylomirabilota bacterium]|nr:VOC family protein [Methylomirabilota bacterium]
MSSIAFDHIALGMPRIADAVPFLVGVLGGVPYRGMRGGPDFRFGTWRYDGGGKIEVIEPVGTDGFVHRFLAARGPGIHHVTFQVSSLDQVCERARARGYDIVGYDDSYDDWKTAFLHPKQALGIVVQFAQTTEGMGPSGWKPPATVANPPAPVTVVGLRMRASAAERAREQWEEILDGTCTSSDERTLVCRWPTSSMVLTIDVDPSGSEGPVTIELRSSRSLALPSGPVRELGTTFQLIQT